MMAKLRPETREAVREGAIASARVLLPWVQRDAPAGILDVGAGEGHWLDVAHTLWPSASMLGCDLETRTKFPMVQHWDAEDPDDPLPLRAGPSTVTGGGAPPKTAFYRWPLVLCLEVAEHVSPAAGEHLVAELCRVADRVIWSAAIPGQGGDGHVNEQAPSYWATMFNQHGWALLDPWRLDLWRDDRIEPWYRQNLLLAQPAARAGEPVVMPAPLHLVHPATFQTKVELAAWWRVEWTKADAELRGAR